jgi:hypothetical protein
MGPEMAAAEEKISIIRSDNSISHCTRRITKIKSGWQTSAYQSAFHVTIEKGMAHGVWIPKGRKTQATLVPKKYQRKEMGTPSYPKGTEQGVNLGLSFRKEPRRWNRLYPGDGRKAPEALDKYRCGGTGKQSLDDISDDNVYFGNVAIRFR